MHWISKAATLTTLLFVFQANAEEAGKTSGPPQKLQARFYQQATPFSGEITRGVLVAQARQFSFVIPSGFRRQVDAAEKKLSLISTGFTCEITATICEAATDGPVDLKPDVLRERVLSRFNSARIVNEFDAFIESMSGPAFEAEWKSDAGMKMTTRAAFIPYPGGLIEFSVQAPTSEIRKYDQSLNQLLLSFRSSAMGEKLPVQEFLTEL
jgi:hypothetical protein